MEPKDIGNSKKMIEQLKHEMQELTNRIVGPCGKEKLTRLKEEIEVLWRREEMY